MLSSMPGIENRQRPLNTLRGSYLSLPCFVALAVVALALCGTVLAAQEPPPNPGHETSPKASLPPDKPAAETPAKTAQMREELLRLQKEMAICLELRQELGKKILGACGLSPENVKPVMLGLERDRFALRIAMKPKEYHAHLLGDVVAKMAEQTKQRSESDQVIAGLKRIVAARQLVLEDLRTKMKGSAVSQADVAKADADLAEAEVRLALRREEIARAQGDGEMERLIRQLRELSAEVTLDQNRIEVFDKQLGMLQRVLPEVDEYDQRTKRMLSIDRLIEQMTLRHAGY